MSKDSASIFTEPIWAIVELMGRNVIAGLIQSVAAAGTELLRVDVPAVDGFEGYTKFYGGSAIYAITPADESSVRHAVSVTKPRAIKEWTVPTRKAPAIEMHEPVLDTDAFNHDDGIPF